MKRYLVCLLALVALSAVVTAWALATGGGNPNPGVLPLQARVGGLTYTDWADAFWEWAFSMPAATDPSNDPTGEWAYLGQPGGPVFLLANTWVVPGQTSIDERWVTVGRDQALFLPVETGAWFAADVCMDGDTCPEGLSGDDVADYLRGCEEFCMELCGPIVDLYATVDGTPLSDLSRYRTGSSDYFSCSYPEGSWLSGMEGPGGTVGDEAGLVPVAVADGYYVLLAPLPEGEHTVTFGATWAGDESTAGVIYHITVE